MEKKKISITVDPEIWEEAKKKIKVSTYLNECLREAIGFSTDQPTIYAKHIKSVIMYGLLEYEEYIKNIAKADNWKEIVSRVASGWIKEIKDRTGEKYIPYMWFVEELTQQIKKIRKD